MCFNYLRFNDLRFNDLRVNDTPRGLIESHPHVTSPVPPSSVGKRRSAALNLLTPKIGSLPFSQILHLLRWRAFVCPLGRDAPLQKEKSDEPNSTCSFSHRGAVR